LNISINLAVFPCGSEIGLEIHRSLKYSIHCQLFGFSSISDHGKFVYENYAEGIPFIDKEDFIPILAQKIKAYNIDAIYPTMDKVITILKRNEGKIGCKVITSELNTTEICLSKTKTYKKFKNVVPTPIVYENLDTLQDYPVFLKPDIGYGSKGTKKVTNVVELKDHIKQYSNSIVLEYLPGKEYTVDCFTNFKGKLLFCGPRQRKRISNGVSVNTATMLNSAKFKDTAEKINEVLNLNGAWFFQVKEKANGTLVLMEVASRLGGSSAVYRMKGINFAMLSVFNAFEIPVSVLPNNYEVELDRALDCKFKISIDFKHVYIDFDDVVILNNQVNTEMIKVIYHFINNKKIIHLITKHEHKINDVLEKYRLDDLFDDIIQLKNSHHKWEYITHRDSIFIDDSFAERKEVNDNIGLPTFSPDMVAGIL
jgi:predicted ATP-grasp superfamily ATP-dependent carboligase